MRVKIEANRWILTALLITMMLAALSSNGSAQKYLPSEDYVKEIAMPEPMKLEWKVAQPFKITATTVIALPVSSSQEERDIAASAKRALSNIFGINLEIMVTELIPEQNAIVVGLTKNTPALKNLVPSSSIDTVGSFPDQSYAISVNSRRVCLVAREIPGFRYGFQTLLQLVSMEIFAAVYVIPSIEIADFPAFEIRALLIPLRDYRSVSQIQDTRRIIDIAEILHMNTVFIQVDNLINYDSVKGIAKAGALDKDSLRAIVKYARDAGLEVIPLINTFSHQDVLLCPVYPNLCLDKSTYDPSNPRTYAMLFSIMDEVIEIFEPKYMHVGHDEIRALSGFPREKAAELFLADIRKIHEHLSKKNVGMMMWAGMLLSSTQFPGQDNCNGLLGNAYALIDSLPKDIVLVDAHYRQRKPDFPTVDYLLSKGFHVLGCVYSDPRVNSDFTKYVAGKHDGFMGMSVALWGCYHYNGLAPLRKTLLETTEVFWRGGIPPEDPKGEKVPQNIKDHGYFR